MSRRPLSTVVKRMRKVYAVSAASSFALGLWTLVHPSSFWGAIGVGGDDPIVQAIYGAAICGEGVLAALGLRSPLRYVALFQYMMAYKGIVCVGLVPRLLLMEDAPLAGWVVVAAWAVAGAQAASVYPWGRWREVVEALRSE